ncbi:hypothetical protein AM588_10010101 [Phytophthora nicotianae]|uniref:WW domain-containing protein n=1 Tax=Phytophthora nicotianae TaxID=4792 RepID=A0A0W8DFH9_PHYNI|nr:hypothetical protein AM588_10010101 [Phytophthora nicotianae]
MKLVRTFDVTSTCRELASHLQIRSGTNSTRTIWKSVFGADTTDVVHLRDFISCVLKTGFLIEVQNEPDKLGVATHDRLITPLLLSLAVDAVRTDCHVLSTSPEASPVISFNLFRLIVRLQKIKEIELKFDHALTNFMQLCQGEQQYLVTIALDASRNLVVRAGDPVFKFSADFELREDEFDYQNLIAQLGSASFERRQQETHEVSRELAFAKAPYGLITSEFQPELNNSMLTIIERLRAELRCRHHSTTSHTSRLHILSLTMVESEAFVSTLRNLLSLVELPFFWSVSPRSLVFSIDSEYLDQQSKPSFQQLVADTLSLHGSQLPPPLRALATFVAHTASSLLVRYEVVGKYTNVETSWQEFQDFISGHQNAYAVMELHPQGSVLTTRVARASGSGAVQWNFKTQIKMDEPKLCDHRIDRPVVFTDTVKVSCIPGSTENINLIRGDSEGPGHFVVISVRRALPNGSDFPKPRLYCTAYDPLTSCDYAVEGYPSDWSVDFFDVTVNPSFESQWQTMLDSMRLGVTITPKLAITVYNKQPKTDKLIGECEVSIGSAVVQEGHIFEERVALPLQEEIRHLSEETQKQKNAHREASNLKDCRLSADASAYDIFSSIREILTRRCPERPYNGLKKALAAEAEVPGKVTFAVLNDVLGDFGLALSSDQRSTLANLFDPEMVGRVNIEDFFINLCGDAEAYEKVLTSRLQLSTTPESSSPVAEDVAVVEYPEPIVFRPTPPAQRPVSPTASPARTSSVRSKMSWQDMKKFLVLNLPEGWETRFTEKGRPYFCNHANRSTQWKHPRPEIETIFSEWVQANGAFFHRKSVSARPCKQK